MNRLLVLAFIFLLYSQAIFSQKNEIDSLGKLLISATNDSSRVDVLLKMAELYLIKNLDSMEAMSLRALNLSRKTGYIQGEAKANLLTGISYRRRGNFSKGMTFCQTALKISTDNNLIEVQADALNNLGVIYNYQGNYPLALETYQKALTIGELKNNNDLIARTLVNIGGIHYNLKDYDQVLSHWEKALKIQLEAGDKNSAGSSMNNIGLTYAHKGNYKQALDWYFRSLGMYDSEKLCARIYPLENIGSTYLETGNMDSAAYYLQQVVDQSATCNDLIIQMSSLTRLSEVHQKQNQIEQALKNLEIAFRIGIEAGLKRETSIAAKLLSQYYEQTGETTKAFDFFKLFHQLQDSLYNEESAKSVGRLEAKYEYEKIKKEEEIEGKIKALEEERLMTKERWIKNSFIVAFVIMIAVVIQIYRSYKRKKESNIRLHQLNREINEQQHELSAQAEQLRTLNDSLIELNNNLE